MTSKLFGVEFYKNKRGQMCVVKPSKEPKPRPVKTPKPPKEPKPVAAKPAREKKPRINAHFEIPGWDEIRLPILERDGYTCRECGGVNQLTVHHIDEDRLNNSADNLITLCWGCHRRKHWHRR